MSKSLHAVERSRQLAAARLGLRHQGTATALSMQAPAAGSWKAAAQSAQVLITGASRPELWPEASWLAVARLCAKRTTDLSGCGAAQRKDPAARAPGSKRERLKCHRFWVADTAAVLAGASLCVGLDTDFSHRRGVRRADGWHLRPRTGAGRHHRQKATSRQRRQARSGADAGAGLQLLLPAFHRDRAGSRSRRPRETRIRNMTP